MSNSGSTEVLRVSILSLDGVQYTTSKNGISAAAAQQKVNISACVGFRSTKSIAVPSSQYTTLFDNDRSSDSNILVVYSDEVVVPCADRGSNVELQWNNKQKQIEMHQLMQIKHIMQFTLNLWVKRWYHI